MDLSEKINDIRKIIGKNYGYFNSRFLEILWGRNNIFMINFFKFRSFFFS